MTTRPVPRRAGGLARIRATAIAAAAATAAALTGGATAAQPAGSAGAQPVLNVKPLWLKDLRQASYDGASDDLLTAGLGTSGLASAVSPTYADALHPTSAELRRAAIWTNYRALVDATSAGGFGRLYGPNVGIDGVVTSGEGKVAGTELLAYFDDGAGWRNVTLMVQIPASFDPAHPCIQTATSSGSRGIYGAISAGEWGLKHGCAVAYTDKGTGAAPHDLMDDTVPLIDGTRTAREAAGRSAQFEAPITEAQRAAFDAATPERFAFKHAHSRRNPEKDWGRFTLKAVEFAFYALNERYGEPAGRGGLKRRTIVPENTLVIASGASNGGGSAIAAAELDTDGLIDGVAAAEPAIEMPADPGVQVLRGGVPQPTIAKTLFEYVSFADLYQSCASQAPSTAGAPGVALVVAPYAANRCASLKAKGLLTATTTADQAEEAQAALRGYGWEPESAVLHASLAGLEVDHAVAVSYANAYSRSSVVDNLCGYSFAATDANGFVVPLADAALATMFASGNGVPPTSGVQIVNNLNPAGPLRDLLSSSPSTGVPDFNLDGVTCMRALLDGGGATGRALRRGIDETRRTGVLHGKPALIVHGRSDALLPVNHTSRPYTALNRVVDGAAARLSYIEVTNAQHFDSFIGLPTVLPGYDSRYVPLHLYLIRALDAVYVHLRDGAPLPASQVVRTVPRGGTPGLAPALQAANVPPIAQVPAAADAITVDGNRLLVPD